MGSKRVPMVRAYCPQCGKARWLSRYVIKTAIQTTGEAPRCRNCKPTRNTTGMGAKHLPCPVCGKPRWVPVCAAEKPCRACAARRRAIMRDRKGAKRGAPGRPTSTGLGKKHLPCPVCKKPRWVATARAAEPCRACGKAARGAVARAVGLAAPPAPNNTLQSERGGFCIWRVCPNCGNRQKQSYLGGYSAQTAKRAVLAHECLVCQAVNPAPVEIPPDVAKLDFRLPWEKGKKKKKKNRA